MYTLVGCLLRCNHTHHCDGISGTYSGLTGATNITTCLPRPCEPGFYSPYSGQSAFFSETCFPCPRNFGGSPIGSTSVSNCTCAPGFFGPAGGPCTPCPSGTYKKDTGTAAACTPCPVAGQWSATMSVDAADCVDQFKQEGEDLRSEIERLKQEGEQVGSQVERLKQEGEDLKSEVERLKQQVERLTKVVTPRSSFMPTGNRTMPGWGSTAYTRCQLPFSWTELNKVTKFYSIVSRCVTCVVFRTRCLIDDSYLCTISSLSYFFVCFIISGIQRA